MTSDWYLLHGDGRHNRGQLGGAPALHQHHGLFHLQLVVEGDELRLGGAFACDQPPLHVVLIEAVQPEYSGKITQFSTVFLLYLIWTDIYTLPQSLPPSCRCLEQTESVKRYLASHQQAPQIKVEVPLQGTEPCGSLAITTKFKYYIRWENTGSDLTGLNVGQETTAAF